MCLGVHKDMAKCLHVWMYPLSLQKTVSCVIYSTFNVHGGVQSVLVTLNTKTKKHYDTHPNSLLPSSSLCLWYWITSMSRRGNKVITGLYYWPTPECPHGSSLNNSADISSPPCNVSLCVCVCVPMSLISIRKRVEQTRSQRIIICFVNFG